MKEYKDLIGQKFNRWTVIGTSIKTNKHYDRYWLCQCECENKTIREVSEDSLIRERSKSCGCYSKEKTAETNKKRAIRDKYPHYKRIYSIYDGMKKRCYNKKKDNYHEYGGRGITICDEWLNDFMNFYNWAINNGYQDDLTIDRIDVNGNYESGNCRWATWEEQFNNKRDTVYITLDGETKNILEWSKVSGLSRSVLWQRFHIFGLKTKNRLFKPVKQITKIIHNGEEKTLSQLSKESGIGVETLRWRYQQGFKDDELTRPADRWYGYEGHIGSSEINQGEER